jgi:ribose 1,5-bisphosphokinase PhnN
MQTDEPSAYVFRRVTPPELVIVGPTGNGQAANAMRLLSDNSKTGAARKRQRYAYRLLVRPTVSASSENRVAVSSTDPFLSDSDLTSAAMNTPGAPGLPTLH